MKIPDTILSELNYTVLKTILKAHIQIQKLSPFRFFTTTSTLCFT